ncbi:dexamethasone-induced protein isoform X2 [Perognathus longimembris pacificus]|uniref:dexamethasone-induced protein isoform X2 n=1 Tax=Perognathus longimembris pacificus TaxID=214514 RepID=UPI0020192758|nr:dexamethasone-induced protein isoform X2 [Perognathus longimembris pacificus]
MGPQEEALQDLLPQEPRANPAASVLNQEGDGELGPRAKARKATGIWRLHPAPGLVTSCWCDVYRNPASLPVLHFSTPCLCPSLEQTPPAVEAPMGPGLGIMMNGVGEFQGTLWGQHGGCNAQEVDFQFQVLVLP